MNKMERISFLKFLLNYKPEKFAMEFGVKVDESCEILSKVSSLNTSNPKFFKVFSQSFNLGSSSKDEDYISAVSSYWVDQCIRGP